MCAENVTRRKFMKTAGVGVSTATLIGTNRVIAQAAAVPAEKLLRVNPEPRYELSPNLYMQFMEPLGVTDGSVSAAWNYKENRWREDVVEATKDLAPGLIRWGGIFASFYRWKEAVGPRDKRQPILNMLWGGMESNQIGTVEFVDFCRQTGADPLMCVNFESDGKPRWMDSPREGNRMGTAQEAAEWVAYCNNPDNALRRSHGINAPPRIPLWQIGNETSYGKDGWDVDTCARKTVEFARAMRGADPSIDLIGWGDSGWAPRMAEIAGEHLQYLAFHHMFNPYRDEKDSPLQGNEYRKDADRTWDYLMRSWQPHDEKIQNIRDEVKKYDIPLAMTESHFALPGRDRCDVLSTWAAGVADARMLNVHERHGDVLKIATLADFCGTRWQVNAVMIPVPGGKSFLMPVAMVMRLYRRHTGEQALDVAAVPDGLDVTASCTGNRIFLHVVNTLRTQSVAMQPVIDGYNIAGGKVYELALEPEYEIYKSEPELTNPKEKVLPADGKWIVPAASVSAMVLDVAV
jgi:alpha-L-arabinofuranosidase